ncbi:MAG: nucleotide exchange factor GrpE [Ruminococcaceae bacterium]|nr:nucleotide exchange factor GrpE [Oscillospiraceae bacterium]
MEQENDINDTTAAEEMAETVEVAEEETKKSDKTEKKKVKELEKRLSECEAALEERTQECAETTDKYLRMMAEYDNFRKRSAKEKESIYADAYADALKSILPIIDNLEKAAEYKDAEKVSKGVEMILKSAADALTKMGVVSFGERGEQFDPNRHNAVMHVEDESLEEGVIVDVFQKGYAKGDRILRYAMVTVAN